MDCSVEFYFPSWCFDSRAWQIERNRAELSSKIATTGYHERVNLTESSATFEKKKKRKGKKRNCCVLWWNTRFSNRETADGGNYLIAISANRASRREPGKQTDCWRSREQPGLEFAHGIFLLMVSWSLIAFSPPFPLSPMPLPLKTTSTGQLRRTIVYLSRVPRGLRFDYCRWLFNYQSPLSF